MVWTQSTQLWETLSVSLDRDVASSITEVNTDAASSYCDPVQQLDLGCCVETGLCEDVAI